MKLFIIIGLIMAQFLVKSQEPSCTYHFKIFDSYKSNSLTSITRHDSLYKVISYTLMPKRPEDNYVNRVIADRGDTSQMLWEIKQLPFRNSKDFLLQIIRNNADTMNIIAHKDSLYCFKVGREADTIVFIRGSFLIFPATNTLSLTDWSDTLPQKKVLKVNENIKKYIRRNYR